MHKISDGFEFWPDRTTDYGVSCPWVKKFSHRLIMGKWCLHGSSFLYEQIIIKVAGNQDRHKSSDEFDFGPLVSMAHLYVFWNERMSFIVFDRIIIIITGDQDRLKISNFKFRPDLSIYLGVNCPWAYLFWASSPKLLKKSLYGQAGSQVSDLCPLGDLFILNINDLPELVKTPCKLFSDDAKIYKEINEIQDFENFQDDLYELCKWTVKWFLLFNIKRCKVMHLGINNPCLKYKMIGKNGKEITTEEVDSEKELSIYAFRSTPSWGLCAVARVRKSKVW